MHRKRHILLIRRTAGMALIIALVLLTGCLKEMIDNELAQQEDDLIKQYIEEYGITASPTSSGLYYIETEEGDSLQPETGDYILIEFTGRYLRDEVVFATTDVNAALANGIYADDILYGPRKTMIDKLRYAGLIEGFSLMKEGGKARFILPSYLAEGDYVPLVYDVTLLKVIKDPAAYEQMLLEEYLLKDSSLTYYDSSSRYEYRSGIYYIEKEAGWGRNIIEGDSVLIAYEGKLVDGRVFELISIESPLGLRVSASLIPGFLKGIKLMKEGSRGIIIIPFDLAYGVEGKDKKIPPYSTLIYDLKILDVN